MTYPLTEDELLKQVCDLVIASGVRSDIMPLEWMSRLLYMHRKHWLYCSVKGGTNLVAVAGAYRIKEWDEKLIDKLPETQEGDILYVPFIAAKGEVTIAPLRLLRFCLKENPNVKEIIYYRKNLNTDMRHYFIKKQEASPQRVLEPQFVA